MAFDRASTEQGRLTNPASYEKGLNRMLAKLRWWASALRDARRQIAYTEAA